MPASSTPPAEALIADGSSLHYAVRRAPASARPALIHLHAVCRSVWNVTRDVHDAGVAAAKLAWWAEELRKTAAGAPTHPQTRALQAALAALPGAGSDTAALQRFVEGCELDLRQSRLLDEAALLHHARLVGGAPWAAAAALLASPLAPQALQDVGAALRLADIVLRLGLDLRSGHVYVPIDELQRFGVKAGELQQGGAALQAQPRFVELMAHQVQRARSRLEAAGGALPAAGADARLSRPARALVALALATLDEVQGAGYAVLDRRLVLTPLRKVWIAWRAG